MGGSEGEDYQRLLKQATSMMIALREIAGICWEVDDVLCDVAMVGKDPADAVTEARKRLSAVWPAMEDVLRADALEKPRDCGHARRFLICGEAEPPRCALCELEASALPAGEEDHA